MLYLYKAVSDPKQDASVWEEVKPAVLGFIGLFLILTSVATPFNIPLLFPGAERVVIVSATCLASALTGSWMWYKFRKSD